MRRLLVLVLVFVVVAVLPSSASAGTASLTLTDGLLRWDVVGDATNSTFHAITRPDLCGDVEAPCVRLRSQFAPTASWPAAPCTASGCPQRVVQAIEMVGDGTGPFQITTTPGATSPDYSCATVPVAIVQQGSDGGTATNDSCVQTIRCSTAYNGRVDADSSDIVQDSCRWLVRDNVEVRRDPPPAPQPEPTPATPTPSPAPPPSMTPTPQPTPGPAAASPLVRVDVRSVRGRRLAVTVRLRKATRFTITIQRRTGRRWTRSATKTLAAKAGNARTTLGVAGPRRAKPGRYRVIISTAGNTTRLVSSPLNVR